MYDFLGCSSDLCISGFCGSFESRIVVNDCWSILHSKTICTTRVHVYCFQFRKTVIVCFYEEQQTHNLVEVSWIAYSFVKLWVLGFCFKKIIIVTSYTYMYSAQIKWLCDAHGASEFNIFLAKLCLKYDQARPFSFT